MTKLNLDDWVSLQRRRKWRWVAKLATTEADAWTTQTVRWNPTLDVQHNTRRRQGRPKTRWTDDIFSYIRLATQDSSTNTNDGTDDNNNNNNNNDNNTTNIAVDASIILQMARDEETWLAMEEGFIKMKHCNKTPQQ